MLNICQSKHPQTIFELSKWGQSLQKATKNRSLSQSFLIQVELIGSDLDHLLHAIEKELATATFMETDQKELGCPKCIRNEAQTVTPAVQPQKAKHSRSAATVKI